MEWKGGMVFELLAADPRTAQQIKTLNELDLRRKELYKSSEPIRAQRDACELAQRKVSDEMTKIESDPEFQLVLTETIQRYEATLMHAPVVAALNKRAGAKSPEDDVQFTEEFKLAMIEFMKLPTTKEWRTSFGTILNECMGWYEWRHR